MVPQRSLLGSLFFLICINDLDDNITSNVLKFVDDTKVFRKVNNEQYIIYIYKSEKWQMLFNFGKCQCLHTGNRNLDVKHKKRKKEKDLGVTISADMKVSEQFGIAASNGIPIVGLIGRNITYKEKS